MSYRDASLVAVLLAALMLGSCSGTGTPAQEGPLPPRVVKLLALQPELLDAADKLVGGDCRQALPLLTVYVGQHEKSALSEYLLARAWICGDEFVKGAHHLARSWNRSDELHEEIRIVAKDAAARLAELYSRGQAGTFSHLRALFLLYQYGSADWHAPAAEQGKKDYAERLAQRGEHDKVVEVGEVMRRVGVSAETTFPFEAAALARLGETERLKALVDGLQKQVPERAGVLLHAAGLEAEAAFRAAEAVELFERCRRLPGPPATLEADLMRVLLKAGRPDDAVAIARMWIAGAPDDRDRALAVADLLMRFDRFDDTLGVLEEGRSRWQDDFRFSRMMIGLSRKLPDKVDASRVLGSYLSAAGTTVETLK
ncbi:MAG: hypothetical protein FJ109_10715, partial [Deltaproteobacteria bacterium]|nr:hypothetical protein [Deltaproteobacteria bacterium]